jgi:protocatechuate 3,4-dioxygenase beta subunit
MKNHFISMKRHPARGLFTLLAVLLLAACSGQTLDATSTQATAQGSPAGIPTTGLPSPTPALATQALVTQAQATPALAASPTPECTPPATLTPVVTEGPYFKANSPERASLIEAGVTGTQLTLTGYVLTADCKPVAHALLDFWQANAQGEYDNTGFTLRGHQFTDATGRYQLETVVPGLYPGRTEHIHVKVQAPNGPVLTTQLFFPGVTDNQSDQIFDPGLLINILEHGSKMQATYNFTITP